MDADGDGAACEPGPVPGAEQASAGKSLLLRAATLTKQSHGCRIAATEKPCTRLTGPGHGVGVLITEHKGIVARALSVQRDRRGFLHFGRLTRDGLGKMGAMRRGFRVICGTCHLAQM